MGTARAEGTSGRKPRANPSAISLSIDNDIELLTARGFNCSSPEARYIVERMSMHRLEAYLSIAWNNARAITFRNGKTLHHGDPELKEVHDLITYDRRVQVIILKYAGIFEGRSPKTNTDNTPAHEKMRIPEHEPLLYLSNA